MFSCLAFACHENGGTSLLYAAQHQFLISAGRKGDVCLWDLRQRTLRHKFTAHESSVAVKCMALDPNEEFFVTGSADGDIKVNKIENLVEVGGNSSLYEFGFPLKISSFKCFS